MKTVIVRAHLTGLTLLAVSAGIHWWAGDQPWRETRRRLLTNS